MALRFVSPQVDPSTDIIWAVEGVEWEEIAVPEKKAPT